MANLLAEKAKKQNLGSKPPVKLIIGQPTSSSSEVKEQTIKLNPNVSRGSTQKGFVLGEPDRSSRSKGGLTAGMGGRH